MSALDERVAEIPATQFFAELLTEAAKMRSNEQLDGVVMSRGAWLESFLAYLAAGKGEMAVSMRKILHWE